VLDESVSNPRIVAELGGAAKPILYAYGPLGLAAVSSDNVTRFAITDELGSVRSLVSTTGNVDARYAYNAYGDLRAASAPAVANNIGFAGEYSGPGDGVQWLRSRAYSPSLGRFLQRDEFSGFAADGGSLNRYAYTQNRPTVFTDPSGHFLSLLPIGPITIEPQLVPGSPQQRAGADAGRALSDGVLDGANEAWEPVEGPVPSRRAPCKQHTIYYQLGRLLGQGLGGPPATGSIEPGPMLGPNPLGLKPRPVMKPEIPELAAPPVSPQRVPNRRPIPVNDDGTVSVWRAPGRGELSGDRQPGRFYAPPGYEDVARDYASRGGGYPGQVIEYRIPADQYPSVAGNREYPLDGRNSGRAEIEMPKGTNLERYRYRVHPPVDR